MVNEKTNGRRGRGRSDVNVHPDTDPSSLSSLPDEGEDGKVGRIALHRSGRLGSIRRSSCPGINGRALRVAATEMAPPWKVIAEPSAASRIPEDPYQVLAEHLA
jgi:hypothetical protein